MHSIRSELALRTYIFILIDGLYLPISSHVIPDLLVIQNHGQEVGMVLLNDTSTVFEIVDQRPDESMDHPYFQVELPLLIEPDRLVLMRTILKERVSRPLLEASLDDSHKLVEQRGGPLQGGRLQVDRIEALASAGESEHLERVAVGGPAPGKQLGPIVVVAVGGGTVHGLEHLVFLVVGEDDVPFLVGGFRLHQGHAVQQQVHEGRVLDLEG
jgi:hypothetical protein